MKYDERACKFNMDTGCVELLLRDGRMISIDCTGVEDALDVTMAQQTELDYLIYNDPLGYTVGGNEAKIRKYIQEQELNDQMCDQLSFKEYEDPFKNVADFDDDDSPEVPTDSMRK